MPGLKERFGTLLGKMRRNGSPVEVDADAASTDNNSDTATMTVESPREATLRELKRGYNDAVETMSAVRSHIEQQAERSNRMLELQQGLPELIRSVPEHNRNQLAVLHAIQEHLEQQHQANEELNRTLARLADVSNQQELAIGQMQQQGQDMLTAMNQLTETVRDVAGAHRSTVQTLDDITTRSRENERRARELHDRSRKQALIMTIISWTLTMAAIGTAGWVATQVM